MQRPSRYDAMWSMEKVADLKRKAHRKLARMIREMKKASPPDDYVGS